MECAIDLDEAEAYQCLRYTLILQRHIMGTSQQPVMRFDTQLKSDATAWLSGFKVEEISGTFSGFEVTLFCTSFKTTKIMFMYTYTHTLYIFHAERLQLHSHLTDAELTTLGPSP